MRIQPTNNAQATSDNNQKGDELASHEESSSNSTDFSGAGSKKSSTISIKLSLILLLLGLVVACVVFLTIVWASSFTGSVVAMSQKLLESNFGQIIDYVDNSMKKIAMAGETSRNAVMGEFDYNRNDWIFDTTFNVYQSQEKFVQGLTINSYFGNGKGLGGYIGITTSVSRQENSPLIYRYKMLGNDTAGYYKKCDFYKSVSTCVHDSGPEWDFHYSAFDMSYMVNYANKAKNTTIFTTSYVHANFPLWIWFTSVSAYTKPGETKFDWYFAIDITAHSLSVFLSEFTKKIQNSMAVVIEIETDALVANNFPDIPPSLFFKNGTSKRKTVFTFENENVQTVGKAVYSYLKNDPKTLTCSSFLYTSVDLYYVGVYRLCTSTGLDWLIIFAVPQWNYISSIIIAVIIASIVSVVITVAATLISFGFSAKIVKPFKQLLNQFEFISEMQLDVAESMKISSTLTEIAEFQEHILTMIKKMKQYRAFIPQHLLAKLDNNESMTEPSIMSMSGTGSKFGTNNQSSRKMGSNQSVVNQNHHQSSSLNQTSNKFLFKLGVEQRQVVCAMIHFEGLDEISMTSNHSKDNTELVAMFTTIFGIIQKFATQSNAMVGSLDKNSVILSWNSSTAVQKAEEKALLALSQMLSALRKAVHDKNLKPCVAVVSQLCKCGNIGTNAVKTFTIIGSHQQNLESMINLQRNLKIEFGITKTVQDKGIEPLFHTRVVSWHNLLMDNYNHSMSDMPIYEVGASKQVAMDEWMYELEQKESGEKWKLYNQGVQMLVQGLAGEAKSVFEEFQSAWVVKHGSKDIPTDSMIRLCSEHNQL